MMNQDNESLIDNVYEVLPKRDCGLCGYGTCRRFARAVVDRRAPPSGCRQDPLAAHRIAEILGMTVKGHESRAASAPFGRAATNGTLTGTTASRELSSIMEEAEEVLSRITALEKRLS
jgi:Na+-translocating ferredoxin:NAD+ oxidoreductase RNF subunit RnfB